MANVAVLLADGFETVEALTVADVLRRAGIKTRLVSVMGTTHVITGQQIQITADKTIDRLDASIVSCYVVPGGMPAIKRLLTDERVCDLLANAMDNPELGLLADRHVTVFPGCEDLFPRECLVDEPVVVDGNLITARSTGCSMEFAVKLVEVLAGSEATRKVLSGLGGAQ